MIALVFTLPLKVTGATAGNSREHPMAKHRRVKAQRGAVGWAWLCAGLHLKPMRLPLIVTLTRVAPRPLDSHDNLRSGLKPAVDELAARLGLKSDADPRVEWRYQQERGGVRVYAVRVSIEPASSGVRPAGAM